MDKIADMAIDAIFKMSMGFLTVILSLEWFTEYNVNIAATITGTLIAAIFGYFRIMLTKEQVVKTRIDRKEAEKDSAFNDKVREHAEEAIIHEVKEREKEKIKYASNTKEA